MCGRYTLSDPGDLLREVAVENVSDPEQVLAPRYNIAPTQEAAVVRSDAEGRRELALLRWGLVPFWAKEISIGSRMINARSETAAEKPSFRAAFKRRRCLILADGFYEWRKIGKTKQPFHIHFARRRPFTMAGLWEVWNKGAEGPLETFTILTTEANVEVSPLHHRMPVILDGQRRDLWLDPTVQDAGALNAVLRPYAGETIQLTPVSTLVNSPRNEVPQCLDPQPIEEAPEVTAADAESSEPKVSRQPNVSKQTKASKQTKQQHSKQQNLFQSSDPITSEGKTPT